MNFLIKKLNKIKLKIIFLVSFSNLDKAPVVTNTGLSMKAANFSADGSLLICSSTKTIIIYNTENMTKIKEFDTNGYINKMKFTPSGNIALVTNKNTLNIYSQTGDEIANIQLKEEGLSFDISQDEKTAYVGSAVRFFFN